MELLWYDIEMNTIVNLEMIWLPLIIIVGLAIVLSVLWLFLRKRQSPANVMDEMEGRDFELFCASLLEEHGFTDVEVTKESGDYGIDILAQRGGVTYAIQCKRYQSPVGVKAIQEAYAGRDYYDCMVGAVLTNQYFTTPAVQAAKKLKILLWDRGYLESMMEE